MLASASTSLKIWDCNENSLSIKSEFVAVEGSVSELSWNHTNLVIAVAGANRKVNLVTVTLYKFLDN